MWTVELTGMPPGPNESAGWRKKARLNKFWREYAAEQFSLAAIPMQSRVRVSAVFIRKVVGRADHDNDVARLKRLLDGMVDAGVIKNDTRRHLLIGSVSEQKGSVPGVKLTIEPIRSKCSRCGTVQDDVEPFNRKLAFCLICYGLLAMAFLINKEHGTVEAWLNRSQAKTTTDVANGVAGE